MLKRLAAHAVFLAALTSFHAAAQQAASSAPAPANAAPVFVIVNGKSLTVAEYDQLAREAFRDKFYHGKPPEAEVQQMLREVGQSMIDRVLLKEAVEKQKIAPDQASVDAEIARYEKQYSGSPQWAAQREAVLPRLRGFLEEKSRLAVLEKQIKAVDLSDAELMAYYEANLTLFTEPEKRKVSIIQLRVDPSSPPEKWKEATERAKQLLDDIRQGASFEETAKQHSTDVSASKGGELGYLHRGMLSEAVELEIDKLKPGEIGGPTVSLEGAVIFRLDDRTLPQLRKFDDVKARARELAVREMSAKAWDKYLKDLRRAAEVAISPQFQSLMAPPAEPEKPVK
jgi:parvulin-like peptidyl-prolyl isomerase